MFHVGALTLLAVNVYMGATSVVMRSFDPVEAWRIIERVKRSPAVAVPAMLNFLLQVPNFEQFDYSTLKWMMTVSGTCTAFTGADIRCDGGVFSRSTASRKRVARLFDG